jgi:hypothetical protein
MGKELDPRHAHQADRVGELGVVRGDDEVARPAQHQAGSDALALHGSDRGLDQVAPALGVVEVAALLPVVVGVDGEGTIDTLGTERAVPAALHVVPRREVLADSAQNDDADLPVLIRCSPRIVELAEDLWGLRVGGLRAVQRNDGDAAVCLVSNELCVHGSPPSVTARGWSRISGASREKQ